MLHLLKNRVARRMVSSMSRALGQPTPWTHPHLMQSEEVTPGISATEFAARRAAFAQQIPAGTAVIIPAHRIRYSSLNIFYPWQQNPNLLYLCGFDEPNAALVLERHSDGKDRWTLFHEGNDHHSLLWSGPKCDEANVKEFFRLDSAEDFRRLGEFLREYGGEFLADLSENTCLSEEDKQFLGPSLKSSDKLRGILDRLRLFKSPSEQLLMQKSAKVAASAFTSVVGRVGSLRQEAQLAALMEYECRMRGASGLAYVPVVAGGDRANIIHYVRNDRLLEPDNLVLMDAGAKFSGYCSDITRTFPTKNPWSSSQQELYTAVWNVQQMCIEAVRRHEEFRCLTLNVLHSLACSLFEAELGALGFKQPKNLVYTLFPHSIGHYLGLDLHDCQSISYDEPLQPGMVITIEPGLYIHPPNQLDLNDDSIPSKYRGIGIRVEDDILIEENGCQVLSKDIPSDPDAIQSLIENSQTSSIIINS